MPLVVMEDRSESGLDRDRQARSRLATMQDTVRSALLDVRTPSSSVYSRTPNMQANPYEWQPSPSIPSPATKPPMVRALFGLVPRTGNTPVLRHMPQFSNPFTSREAATAAYSPATQPTEWGRSPAQPSPIAHAEFRHPADVSPILDSGEGLAISIHARRKKHKRKHRKAPVSLAGSWTRNRKTQAGSRTCSALFQGETRPKAIATMVSGSFLVTVLTMYLSIAISIKTLNQQIHILFILVVIAALIFFIHSLFRLLLMIHRRKKNPHRRHRPQIPSISGPEGFKPDIPIPVQLARNDELGDYDEEKALEEMKDSPKPPPPAYGLWRGSVRLDPNLLHWQRNEGQGRPEQSRDASPNLSDGRLSPQASPILGATVEGPVSQVRRPPSYISEDGIDYVVSALPPAPPSEIHPALRIRL